jgi:two-component system KDP operon response regulator KdpE
MRKPLPLVEFKARLRALLRRTRVMEADKLLPQTYHDDYLAVDVPLRMVSVSGEEVKLTPTEFKLLAMFVQHPREVLTFQQLLESVWGFEYTNEHHYPRIYVSHLRRKIEADAQNPTYVQSEYGVGYRFVPQN